MKTFLDSSALAKRYVAEPGSERVDDLLAEASSLGVSVVCLPEIVSALCRRRRERALGRRQYDSAKAAVLGDIADADVIQLTPEVVRRAVDLLERHPLGTIDALHIGGALAWEADRFVSADRRQVRAALSAGLDCVQV
jgi:predicted nucleic acid-binding protein